MYIWIYNTLNADKHIAIQMGRIPGGPRQVVANAAGGDGCPMRSAVRSRFAATSTTAGIATARGQISNCFQNCHISFGGECVDV